MDQSYYLFEATDLRRKDDSLKVSLSGGDYRYLPIEKIRDIYLFSETAINLALLRFLGSKHVMLHIFNHYGSYNGSYIPKEHYVSGDLLLRQVRAFDNSENRLQLAKAFVESAAHNMMRNIRYYSQRGLDIDSVYERMLLLSERTENCHDVESLMGIEGGIRQAYYRAWSEILPTDFALDTRSYRPVQSPINAIISYVNMMVYTTCLTEIYKTPLNPTISYLHVPGNKRFSLCLDIAEIFKPLIADRMIFSLINKKQITIDDFDTSKGTFKLQKQAIKTITAQYDKKLSETIKHKTLNRKVSYRTLIRLECWKLIKHLMGEKNYDGYRLEW